MNCEPAVPPSSGSGSQTLARSRRAHIGLGNSAGLLIRFWHPPKRLGRCFAPSYLGVACGQAAAGSPRGARPHAGLAH